MPISCNCGYATTCANRPSSVGSRPGTETHVPISTRRTEDTRRSSCSRVRSEGCHRHKQSSTHTNPCTPRASHPARRGRPSTPTRPPPCPRRRGRGAHNVARTNRGHGRRGPLRGRTIPRRTPRTRRRGNRRPSSCCPPVPRPPACPRVAPPRPRTDRRWNLARRPLSPRWNLVKRPLGPRLTRAPRCCPPHRPPRQWTALPPLPPLPPLQPLQPLQHGHPGNGLRKPWRSSRSGKVLPPLQPHPQPLQPPRQRRRSLLQAARPSSTSPRIPTTTCHCQ